MAHSPPATVSKNLTTPARPASGALSVAVIGQGYVGLPLAVAAAQAGCVVVGVDHDPGRVAQLGRGKSPVGDVADSDIAELLGAGRYRASLSYEEIKACDVVVICVPTPYADQAPDLSHVESAASLVGANLRSGALVILESTTYPGTTRDLLVPAVESASGATAGEDFDVAFSPERIDPGNPTFGIHNTPKIVGGIDERSTKRAAEFYKRFVDDVVEVSSPAAAEMAKLLENTFRHINIALVNELAMLCRDMGIDVWEVIEAAASKPFGFMAFYPGPGVGGHCIPVDPMYLSWRVRQMGGAAKFIELARDVNDAMPLYCVSRIQDLLNEHGKAIKGSRILVLGVAYKPDISDVRGSPALPFVAGLMAKGAEVLFHDPYVPDVELPTGEILDGTDLDEALRLGVDCAVLVTPHSAIDYSSIVERVGIVFDTRNSLGSSAKNVFKL